MLLQSLLDLAQDATEVGELIKSRDFSQQRSKPDLGDA